MPRSVSKIKVEVDALILQAYYVNSELYELGRTKDDFDMIIVPVYDRKRTICSGFKYRSRLDDELFIKQSVHT